MSKNAQQAADLERYLKVLQANDLQAMPVGHKQSAVACGWLFSFCDSNIAINRTLAGMAAR